MDGDEEPLRFWELHESSRLKDVALEYCRTHPEARQSIITAALRAETVENPDKTHRFTNGAPWGRCIHCQTTRETTLSPYCPKWQAPADIVSVIRREETLFNRVLDRARKVADSLKVEDLTGEALCHLHHTHGIDPSMLEAAMGQTIPERLHSDYQKAYQVHQATGKRGEKKTVLVAKTA